MVETPKIEYVQAGDVSLAYSVVGDGPIDLVIVPGFVSHLELSFEDPGIRGFMDGLAAFARVIVFDKRGTGSGGAYSAATTK